MATNNILPLLVIGGAGLAYYLYQKGLPVTSASQNNAGTASQLPLGSGGAAPPVLITNPIRTTPTPILILPAPGSGIPGGGLPQGNIPVTTAPNNTPPANTVPVFTPYVNNDNSLYEMEQNHDYPSGKSQPPPNMASPPNIMTGVIG